MSLTEREEAAVKRKLPRYSSMLVSAIAKLYIADPSGDRYEWQDTQLVGAIVLLVNRKLDTCIVRMYDVRSKIRTLFEYEVYFGIRYHVLHPKFHAFEMQNHVLGIMFSDDESAEEFGDKFVQYVVNGKAKLDEDEEDDEDDFGESSSSQRTILQRFKNVGKKTFDFVKKHSSVRSIEQDMDECELGEVTRVDHVAHIGLSEDGKIDWTVIPPEWKKEFKRQGMRKKDFEKNPVLKEKLVSKYEVYAKRRGQGPPRPKSAKPSLRKRERAEKQKNAMTEEKRQRFIETFRKMRGKVPDKHLRTAMLQKGLDPSLVFDYVDSSVEKSPPAPPVRERHPRARYEMKKDEKRTVAPLPVPKPRPHHRHVPPAPVKRGATRDNIPDSKGRRAPPVPRTKPRVTENVRSHPRRLPPKPAPRIRSSAKIASPQSFSRRRIGAPPKPAPRRREKEKAPSSAVEPREVTSPAQTRSSRDVVNVEASEAPSTIPPVSEGISLDRFKKMSSIGLPENAIRGRMTAAGISQSDIDAFFGHKGPTVKIKAPALSSSAAPVKLRSVKDRPLRSHASATSSLSGRPLSKPSMKELLLAKKKKLHKLDMAKIEREKEEMKRKESESSAMGQFREIFAARRKNLGGDFTSSGEEWSEDDGDYGF